MGTSLTRLEVLHVSRCQMEDISGINGFMNLKELFAPFNNIQELSSICYHQNLQILDLEDNEISDIA